MHEIIIAFFGLVKDALGKDLMSQFTPTTRYPSVMRAIKLAQMEWFVKKGAFASRKCLYCPFAEQADAFEIHVFSLNVLQRPKQT